MAGSLANKKTKYDVPQMFHVKHRETLFTNTESFENLVENIIWGSLSNNRGKRVKCESKIHGNNFTRITQFKTLESLEQPRCNLLKCEKVPFFGDDFGR